MTPKVKLHIFIMLGYIKNFIKLEKPWTHVKTEFLWDVEEPSCLTKYTE